MFAAKHCFAGAKARGGHILLTLFFFLLITRHASSASGFILTFNSCFFWGCAVNLNGLVPASSDKLSTLIFFSVVLGSVPQDGTQSGASQWLHWKLLGIKSVLNLSSPLYLHLKLSIFKSRAKGHQLGAAMFAFKITVRSWRFLSPDQLTYPLWQLVAVFPYFLKCSFNLWCSYWEYVHSSAKDANTDFYTYSIIYCSF